MVTHSLFTHNSSTYTDYVILLDQCIRVPDPRARRDLIRMTTTASDIFKRMDQELVNCRRVGHLTLLYTELEEKFTAQVKLTSKYMLMCMIKYS